MDIEAAVAEVRALPPGGAIAREAARLRRDAVAGSLAIAGSPLHPAELSALLDRGVALGGHPLRAYIAARDLAAAAAWLADQRPYRPEDRRPLLSVEDIRHLHQLACAGETSSRPGGWRLTVRTRAEIVSPPPWQVAFETANLAEHVRLRPPPATLAAWSADLLARFARVRPFAAGNGRVARLALALLWQRLDLPPPAFARTGAGRYRAALQRALRGEPAALRGVVERTAIAACNRLVAAAGPGLVPLRDLAGPRYAALIKAVQRDRLRAVVRDGRVYTTAAWVAEYRAGSTPPRSGSRTA